MSVTFGIKEPREIVIAGDKRATSVNDKVRSDDINKLTIVNECVCFAAQEMQPLNAQSKSVLKRLETPHP